ncbi:MAG: hypothetical protein ACYTFE_07245, partial [Planctomycetota bacterium]
MARKELYIHIGMPKTATTALQQFFAYNKDLLCKKGISFPVLSNTAVHDLFQTGRAHHRLGWAFELEQGDSNWWFDKDVKDHRKEWKFLLKQFNTKKNIISTETFWGLHKEHIQVLRELTSDFDVKIIAYLRRQDSLDESWYNELVKIGIVQSSFNDNFVTIPNKNIITWVDVFNKKIFLIRPFEKQQFYKRSIFADFMHHVFNMEISEDFILPKRIANIRLHRVVLEYKRLLNCLSNNRRQEKELIKAIRKTSQWLKKQGVNDYTVLSPQQKLDIVYSNRSFYEKIAREYLGRPDGVLFYDPLPNPNEEWQPYDELLEKDARLINEHLLRQSPEALNIIVRKILRAQYS